MYPPNCCLPVTELPEHVAKSLLYFFTDIDDTVSSNGQITSEAYTSLWQLHQAGIHVVPITGRPAGWCDLMARMWPVAGVVGENGAFYFCYDRSKSAMKRHYLQTEADRKKGIELLATMRQKVLHEVPGCGISADQDFRYTDLAIDFCEDVEPLPTAAIDRICEIARDLSLTYKVSSIHVNCWYGQFDKLSCMKQFLLDHSGKNMTDLSDNIVFSGDSPNDEPMFAGVCHSIAVANIKRFLPRLTHFPKYITTNSSGQGFVEAVTHILSLRNR